MNERPPVAAAAATSADARRDTGDVTGAGLWTYRAGRLSGKKAVIKGADSGMGRAVAIAFARESADVLIDYLNERKDAEETKRGVEEAGRKAVLVPGDIQSPQHCRSIIDRALRDLGGIDIHAGAEPPDVR